MAELHNIHWTNDESLLERYALGQLRAEEVAQLDKHLHECEQCQNAVRGEQDIVAGVRRAGRDALKRRLAQRLEHKSTRDVGWYRIAGVAAAIVFLVTVGIYNRWFFQSGTQQADVLEKTDKVVEPLEPTPIESPQAEKAPAKQGMAEATKSAAEEKRAPGLTEVGSGAKGGGLDQKKISDSEADRARRVEFAQTNKPERESAKEDKLALQAGASRADQIWVQGTVIVDHDERRAADQAMPKNAEGAKDALIKSKREARPSISLMGRSQSVGGESQNVEVSQRPLSALPPVQRSDRQVLPSVQTLLQRDANGVRMVLYLDSLVSKKELDQASVQTIREDSIILKVGHQRIGYRIPVDWNEQLARRIKRTK